jgi:hypothetical protein
MNPTAIYSKSGKGVQEASGKTSNLSRADRAVLSAFDGKVTVKEVADRLGRPFDAKFEQLIQQLDKDGYVRAVTAGAPAPGAAKPAGGAAAKPGSAPAKPAAGSDLDFTTIMPAYKPPAAPASSAPDLAAKARADAEHKAKEEQAHSFKARQEAEAKAAAAAAAKQRQEAEERAKRERERVAAEAAAKAKAEAEPKKADSKPLFEMPSAPAKASDAQSQASAFARAREEAEEKAAKERDRIKAEAEAKARAEFESRAKSEAEIKAKEDAERKSREADEKIKAAREAAVRAAAEAKAKAEAELQAKLEAERARAREEAERVRREAEEKARKEAEELQRKLDEERKAREEAERKAREEARRRQEEDERRAREEAERKAKEEAERKERERKEAERRAREEQERKAREAREQEEAERRERHAREDAEREERRSKEEAERAEREEQERLRKEKEKAKPKRAPTGDQFADSLMADLDSFTEKDEEDLKAKEEQARKEKEELDRAREVAEKRAKEEAKRKREEDDERKRRDQEEEEGREREEKERAKREAKEKEEREAEERRKKEEEEEREAEERRAKRKAKDKDKKRDRPAAGDDIGVSDDDLDMDDVKRDQKAVSEESRKQAKDREKEAKEREREAKDRAKEREREAKRAKAAPPPPVAGGYAPIRRRRSWGKPIATTLFIVLVGGVGLLHVMPLDTAPYEKAVAEAIGRPVKISSAHLSLYNGLLVRLEGVTIGDVKIKSASAYPQIGALFDDKKVFSRIAIDSVTVPLDAVDDLLAAKIKGERFAVEKVSVKDLKFTGPLVFPPLEGDLAFGSDGAVTSAVLRGPDNLSARIAPTSAGQYDFDVTANSLQIPLAPDVSLSGFAMKGKASADGVRIENWGGGTLDGAVSGTATVRWGSNWNIDGVMTIRGMNAAVFAPALLSEGKFEGTGRFSLHGADPTKFTESGRIEGNFSVPKGVLGSFDLSRAISTGGRQAEGRTPFNGLTAQGVFDRGTVALRNVTFSAGALNAGASADIAKDGALSGRIVADVKTATQTLRATVNLGGTIQEPRVRN